MSELRNNFAALLANRLPDMSLHDLEIVIESLFDLYDVVPKVNRKVFRAYFNRRSDAPRVWSVDAGTQDSEINVTAFFTDGCAVRSRYNGETPNENTPVAWLEIEAERMEVAGGVAKFLPQQIRDGRP